MLSSNRGVSGVVFRNTMFSTCTLSTFSTCNMYFNWIDNLGVWIDNPVTARTCQSTERKDVANRAGRQPDKVIIFFSLIIRATSADWAHSLRKWSSMSCWCACHWQVNCSCPHLPCFMCSVLVCMCVLSAWSLRITRETEKMFTNGRRLLNGSLD